MTLYLCGFMGCGKSTIGARLAERLGCPFLDMDSYIEEYAGMTISQIFEQYGESHFRDLETQAIRELGTRTGVIACGGGAMLREENARLAREHGMVLYLDVPFSTCYVRIANTDRPIVKANTRHQLEELYNKRRSLYQAHCTHCIPAEKTPNAAVLAILEELGL